MVHRTKPLRLNVGCGGRRVRDYIGIDIVQTPATDLVGPIDSLPYDDNTVTEILAIHVLEHIHIQEVPKVLFEWYRVLIPGGQLSIEVPDLQEAARNILEDPFTPCLPGKPGGDAVRQIYGERLHPNPYMAHQWGYTPQTLSHILRKNGYCSIEQQKPIYKRKVPRGMRIVSYKPFQVPKGSDQ